MSTLVGFVLISLVLQKEPFGDPSGHRLIAAYLIGVLLPSIVAAPLSSLDRFLSEPEERWWYEQLFDEPDPRMFAVAVGFPPAVLMALLFVCSLGFQWIISWIVAALTVGIQAFAMCLLRWFRSRRLYVQRTPDDPPPTSVTIFASEK